jgi:hypothetical protein
LYTYFIPTQIHSIFSSFCLCLISVLNSAQFRKSINNLCGNVDIDVLRLGKDPILSKDNRDMLIYCSVIAGAAATSSGLVSANFLSGKGIEASAIAGVTALTTFLTEIGIELRIRRNQDSK